MGEIELAIGFDGCTGVHLVGFWAEIARFGGVGRNGLRGALGVVGEVGCARE